MSGLTLKLTYSAEKSFPMTGSTREADKPLRKMIEIGVRARNESKLRQSIINKFIIARSNNSRAIL